MNTLVVLGEQHQDVLGRLAAVETQLDSGEAVALGAFVAYLEQEVVAHFAVEEEALFPILARHLSMTHGPLAVMNSEHLAFRELLAGLGVAVRTHDQDAQRTHATELIELLRAHIMKEDQVLFPMAGRLLAAAEQHDVDARAAALGASEIPLV